MFRGSKASKSFSGSWRLAVFDTHRVSQRSRAMEQDRGDRGAGQQRKATMTERWRDATATKTVVFWSCVASIVLTMIVGFAWGGWVTGATAQTMADKIAQDAVVKRLGPICVVQFNRDPAKAQKLTELKATDSWQQSTY